MKRYIHITKNDREFLMKTFGVTQRTVFNALNYVDGDENEQYRRMRSLALQRGGVDMVEGTGTECLHDADGYMRQYLPGGVLLEFDKSTGDCDVFRKGMKVATYRDVQVSAIDGIQRFAATLS